MNQMPSAAFAFGRFNPAHKGHVAVWETVKNSAPRWFIGTNGSTYNRDNPLPFKLKAAWMVAIWPELRGHILEETSVLSTAADIYQKLGSKSGLTIAYITDTDDWNWSGKLLNDYNGREGSHGYYEFAEIIHVPSPRVSSATALRTAATEENKEAFYAASGTDPNLTVAGKPYYETVRDASHAFPAKRTRTTKAVSEAPTLPNTDYLDE